MLPITLLSYHFNQGGEKIILTIDYSSSNLDLQNDESNSRDFSYFRGAITHSIPSWSNFEIVIIEQKYKSRSLKCIAISLTKIYDQVIKVKGGRGETF